MNPKEKALQSWDKAKSSYEHMNRASWVSLYPGWTTTVKAHFLMGWIAGQSNDIELRNTILSSGAMGDQASMTTVPFMHGFGEGYLSTFDDAIDVDSRSVELRQIQSLDFPGIQP